MKGLDGCVGREVRSQNGEQISKHALRPVARGGTMQPPKSAKRSTSVHKMGQKWGFCRRVKGGEVQKVHFLGPKCPLFGVPPPPQKKKKNQSWLRVCMHLSKCPNIHSHKSKFSLAWAFCFESGPITGLKCVATRSSRLNKHTDKQTNKINKIIRFI